MKRGLLIGLSLLPVLYYVATVLAYAYDFPYMDDYPTIVDFLNRLPATRTVEQTIDLLLEQNNFHRLVLVKLIAWLNVLLTGVVDFRLLQYVGLAFLLLTAGLLWQSSKAGTGRSSTADLSDSILLHFLPVLFLLFQFQSWNIAFWSIVAVSNVGAPALALLAFWLASRQQMVWAMAVGLLALFTNGNGILVLPLLVAGWAVQGRWRWSLVAVLVMIPAFWLYFQHYENPAGPSLGTLLQPGKLAHLLALDTAFLGALVYHPAVPWLPIGLGSATLLWMTYLLLIRYDRANPTLFWLLIFLHLSGLMLAVNRIQNDTSIVFASRYRNITALHIAATYLTLVQVLLPRPQVRWQIAFFGLAVLGTFGLWGVSNWTYHSKIVRFRELKQTDNLLWQRYGQIRACAPQYQPARQLSRLAQAGYFRPGAPALEALRSRPVALLPTTTPGDSLQYAIDLKRVDAGFLVVSGWAKVAGRKANFNDTYVGLQTPGGWRYYTTLFHQRLDREDSANDKDTGFTAIIPLTGKIDAANLPLAIFVKSGRFAALSTPGALAPTNTN